MILIRLLVQRLGQEVLLEVVFAFLSVRQIAIAGIETLGQQEQAAKPVSVFCR